MYTENASSLLKINSKESRALQPQQMQLSYTLYLGWKTTLTDSDLRHSMPVTNAVSRVCFKEDETVKCDIHFIATKTFKIDINNVQEASM